MNQAQKNFLRSIELCPVYVRAWAGIQVVSTEALKIIAAHEQENNKSSSSSLVTDKEKKYFTKFAELSERKLLYATSESDLIKNKGDFEAAKLILQNY